MKVALTGGTGFIGRYIIREFVSEREAASAANSEVNLNCWIRSQTSQPEFGPDDRKITWLPGDLSTCDSVDELVADCDAVVHNAFWKPGDRFQGGEGNIVEFVQTNVIGTLKLIEAARSAGVKKFLFVSTCAVHDVILEDRTLDEAHPLWPKTHYGAHKAAIEKFVHSYGLGHGFNIGAIRPTGVYGLHHEPAQSKWFGLVKDVVDGKPVTVQGGGKEVHAADVAKAIRVLLESDQFRGEAFSCYDQYVSQYDVAHLARELSGSDASISGEQTRPRNQIDASKIKSRGMTFGGQDLLRQTIEQLVHAARVDASA